MTKGVATHKLSNDQGRVHGLPTRPWPLLKKLLWILLKRKVFRGLYAIEVMAKRGIKTMLYDSIEPVGLEYLVIRVHDGDFKTPYAVVQLRQDNAAGSLYNICWFPNPPQMGRISVSLNGFQVLKTLVCVMGLCHSSYFGFMACSNLELSVKIRAPNLFFWDKYFNCEGCVESTASGFPSLPSMLPSL